MEELDRTRFVGLSVAELHMLMAYELTCDAARRHSKLYHKPMGDDEWWTTLRDNFFAVSELYKCADIWRHSRQGGGA